MALNIEDEDVKVILASNLWRSISAVLCPEAIDEPRLLGELVRADRHLRGEYGRGLRHQHDNINAACTWDRTPQGQEFWEAIHSAYGVMKPRGG